MRHSLGSATMQLWCCHKSRPTEGLCCPLDYAFLPPSPSFFRMRMRALFHARTSAFMDPLSLLCIPSSRVASFATSSLVFGFHFVMNLFSFSEQPASVSMLQRLVPPCSST